MPHHCFRWLKHRSTTLRCTAADLLPRATETMTGVPGFLSFYAERIDAGEHGGDMDRLSMGMASVRTRSAHRRRRGVGVALPGAVAALLRRGMDAGQAADSAPAWWS